MQYMVTFTFIINIPPMLVYIPAPWILWVMVSIGFLNLSGHKISIASGHKISIAGADIAGASPGMLQGSTASHMFDDTMMYW